MSQWLLSSAMPGKGVIGLFAVVFIVTGSHVTLTDLKLAM